MEKQNVNSQSNARRIISVASSIIITVFFIAIAIWYMDWYRVLDALSNTKLYPWFFLSVLSYSTGLLVRGVRTRLLVRPDANLSVLTASNIVVVGYAVNTILPARMGELARAAAKPILYVSFGANDPVVAQALAEVQIPSFSSAERALQAYARVRYPTW